jgi:hypothetical protein
MSIDRVVVNADETFENVLMIDVQPKLTRSDPKDLKSSQVHATDKEGVPKWAVSAAVSIKSFEQIKNEIISITVVRREKPFTNILVGSHVKLIGLVMGIMPQQRGGYSTFFSCEDIKPVLQDSTAYNQ